MTEEITQVTTEINSNVFIPETRSLIVCPPQAPSQNNVEIFVPGRFDYIECIITRDMLRNGYHAINQLELWDYMKKNTESYMWSEDKEPRRISQRMSDLGIGHSGSSFGWTMRELQSIAVYGEETYKNTFYKK